MIPVTFHRGLHLPEADLWLDPWDAKPLAFVSHAHADHFARHQSSICSTSTAALVRARYRVAESRLLPLDFHAVHDHAGHRIRLLPAGHILGSAMIHVTRLSDGATLLYTGDFKTRRGRTAEQVEFRQADQLVLETTFGLPRFTFPPPLEVEAEVMRFVHSAFHDGDTPVLLGYSLGKAQEALALLHEHGVPALLHPTVAEMTRACRASGVDSLPEPLLLEGGVPPGTAVVAPPNSVRSKLLRAIPGRRVAMLSGWALSPGARFRYRVDDVFPLSDHADHPGLLECVRRVRPQRVLTVHGFAREFAAELRQRGIDAWSAAGNDQLELAIARSDGPDSPAPQAPRLQRPTGELADFTDICRLVGETNSRTRKVELLAGYLRGIGDGLPVAATWLTGRALPRRQGRLRVGAAALRRALLALPGAREERYREISLSQNDTARTARLMLQELPLEPRPIDLGAIVHFLAGLAGTEGSLAKVAELGERLRTLHPSEGETLVKLLTGDLRIGLKEGLVEEALIAAFNADPATLRRAHMLTGDLGETAELARDDRLSEATLHPGVALKLMLASPEATAEALLERHASHGAGTPGAPPLWLEPKYDGIRAQLHKGEDGVHLFSRDLRPLDSEFPELLEAARGISDHVVLDGEIIAHAAGRRLNFFDLQKRLGRQIRQGELFGDGSGTHSLPPVRFVAFDCLLRGERTLIDLPLHERRRELESCLATIPPASPFAAIDVIRARSVDEVGDAFKQAIADHHEGLISKDPASGYAPGRRGKAWLKLKGVMPTLDCVVIAAEQGHGRRAEVLSDYTFAVRDAESGALRTIGKAYSGLTDREIEELTEHFRRHTIEKRRRKHLVEANLVLEIAFDSINPSRRHDSGLALRFPRIKAIRRDKTAEDIDSLQYARSLLDL